MIETIELTKAYRSVRAVDGLTYTAQPGRVTWFLGLNDAAVSLHDPVSGGGCDGLLVYGRNENQGAESTLALLCTLQQAHRVASDR